MSKRIALFAAAVVAVSGLAVQAATASPKAKHAAQARHLIIGINDEANTLYGNPAWAFPQLKTLRAQAIRVNLYWGGTKWAVANKRPNDATDPGDPAYNWTLYDRLVRYASQYNIKVVFSILFTPSWASGGQPRTHVPTNFKDLQDFAYAAAERYSGLWTPPSWQQDPNNATTATPLPKVTMWTAWNEPNNPIWLAPQYRRVGKTWRVESAFNYAKICNAVYAGVHSTALGPLPDEQVACGVTGPRGNDSPRSGRASVDPLTFMTQTKRYGLKTFDVWAHHPYPLDKNETPTSKPKYRLRVELGNINVLLAQLSRLWGPKHLWITEYGFQTNPPDRALGVSYKTQALYMKQAYAIARANPRIDMLLWFLLKDEPNISGWQSGLFTAGGAKKPAYNTFRLLPR